jgi:ankyrin repeat protein
MDIGLTYIRQGDFAKTKEWVAKNRNWLDVRSKDIQDSPLHIAIKTHQFTIFELLVEITPNIDPLNSLGDTPLHTACNENLILYAERLLNKGAEIDHRESREGSSPLHRATERGFIEIVKVLLDYGASIESLNNSGETPIHIAAELNFKEIMELLIASHANVNSTDLLGNTALHKGCRANLTVFYT